MSYTPNFTDPRIQRAARKALTFVELYTKSTEVSWISSKELYKNFGNTTRPLGHWLKSQLLETRDHYFNPLTGACKKYSKRSEGVELVKQLINEPDFVPEIKPETMAQIASGQFDYTEKSDRLFTPAQFIPKRIRTIKLNDHGYRYQYDIEAAAPTLLLQRAQQINRDFAAPALEYYINNRSEIRKLIAQQCVVSQEQVKFVINAVLQGAVISTYRQSKIFMTLNYDYDAIKRLQNNDLMQNIKEDIRKLWQILKCEFPVRTITDKNNKKRTCRLSGSDKSGYYRSLENPIGELIRKILRKNKMRYLWLHDGWCCDKAIDPNEIVSQVRRQTGFVIKLDWTIYED